MQHKDTQPVNTEILENFDGSKLKIGIVTSTFHSEITQKLEEGAVESLKRNGVLAKNITITHVRGSFEVPLATQRLARGGMHGVIALGCIIKGQTDHYDYVCGESIRGVMDVMLAESLPVGLGIATVNTTKQAIERAGESENLGENAALAVLDLLR